MADDPLHQDGIGAPDGLERLWTPYRIAYLRGENKPADDSAGECPFCRIAASGDDAAGLVVRRGELSYAVLNLYPYAPGHLMVCPYRHIADYTDTTAAEAQEMTVLTKTAMRVLRSVSNAEGFNIGVNQGVAGGAGIAAHLHQHVVPRWVGDQNFMPVIGHTKTLPQLLQETRELLGRGVDVTDLAEDAALAASLVRDAGRLAARMRAEGLSTHRKTSVSDVVTAADRAAERLITDRLTQERPGDAVVGEEGTDRPGSSGRSWVIDPVDGTYNFVRGLTWWCSAIALRGPDDVLLGAVHHPHDDTLFVGGPTLPPTRNGVRLPMLHDRPLAESCASTYLNPPFYRGDVGAAFVRAVSGVATLRMLGSGTMDQMAVAQGQMDVLFQHSVSDWDWYPGTAIVRGVGGAARRVSAGGVEWSVSGVPTAVAEVCAAFEAEQPTQPTA